MSTLGCIEELGRVASDTAGIMTLYYREQIQSIDMSGKIPETNVFNDKIRWIKDVFVNFRPEGTEEMPVIIVAEYVTAWIIDALKVDKSEFMSTELLPQQLWLRVARRNPIELENLKGMSDIVGVGAGRQIIPVIVKNKETNNEISVKMPLQYLIGCASIITDDGKIYEYPMSENSVDNDLKDLRVYGYVYTSLFSSNQKSFEEIVNRRKLHASTRSPDKSILKRFDDIIPYAAILINRDNDSGQSFILTETVNRVSQVLREQKTFYDANDLAAEVEKTHIKIDNDVEVIKERMQHRADYYQTSIEAFRGEMKLDYDRSIAVIQRDNEDQCNQITRKLMEVVEQMDRRLEENISRHMIKSEQQLQMEWTKMETLIGSTRTHSNEATTTVSEAVQACQHSAEEATHASEDAKKLLEAVEIKCTEFVKTTEKHETTLKQVPSVIKLFEGTISSERAKSQKVFESEKQRAVTSATKANQSSRAAQESFSSAQKIMTRTDEESESRKRETNDLIAKAQLAMREIEQSTALAALVVEQAKPLADRCKEAVDVFHTMYGKFEKALERLEKKAKKLPTK
jgi:hypothetical protein